MTVQTENPSPKTERLRIPASSRAAMDAALAELTAAKDRWLQVDAAGRRKLIDALRQSYEQVAERWVAACLEAEGLPPANPAAGEEWIAGPYFVFRNLRLLGESLDDIALGLRPRIAGPVDTLPNGQVTAQVFPGSLYDRALFPGVTAEVWMEPGVTLETVGSTQAVSYFEAKGPGRVCLVLGAGNVSSIGPLDALYKLFVEDAVVLYKAHPVNDYLGPLLEEGFAPLVEAGVLRVVYGGAEEGSYLTRHPQVEEIHITGSDRTVEAIVFGPGAEGARRKAERRPLLEKPISSELGNVSPVIVLPGPWSPGDIEYQAENLVSMIANNAGFNCNAARLVITQRGWAQRHELLDAVRSRLRRTPTRLPYYPATEQRLDLFLAAHPDAERFGDDRFGRMPWTFIPNLDAERKDEPCFEVEAFAPLFGEMPLAAEDPAEFVRRAVAFANERTWGTLNATLIVHPATLRDEKTAAAFDQALADLRYGTVSINHWAAVGYGLGQTPWGAYPGSDLYDIRSGSGFVHNTLMFSRVQKAIVRSPFRAFPKPPWFVSHKTAHDVGRYLTDFERSPSLAKLARIAAYAVAG